MTDHTPADPLDEAIEAAVKAFIASRRPAGTMDYFRTSYTAEAVEDAVRAAAPIIAAPIQARLDNAESDLLDHAADFRDALADLTTDRDRWKRQYGHCLAERDDAWTANADLRARLATAERDALTRAADELDRRAAAMSEPGDPLRSASSAWLRERAKEAGSE